MERLIVEGKLRRRSGAITTEKVESYSILDFSSLNSEAATATGANWSGCQRWNGEKKWILDKAAEVRAYWRFNFIIFQGKPRNDGVSPLLIYESLPI